MTFIEKLNDLLLEKGKTRVELSNEANIPYTTIYGWVKSGRLPDFNAIKKLANYFNVSTDYILDYENDYGVKANDNPIQHYTKDEQQLIKAYRAMSAGKKKALFDMLDIEQTSAAKKNNGY